ncbi:MAG: hypothetical protein EPO02_12780 [Nitrospirae bacterium]|nr:MAG: hypothetical protein EPO02_12780 [Nitrospirota bacterium]
MSNADKWLARRSTTPSSQEHPATKWLKRAEGYENTDEDEIPHEEKKGFPGVWSDIKEIAGSIPSALVSGAVNAPGALSQLGGQLASLPFENAKFAYKTAKEGFNPENAPRLTQNILTGLHKSLNLPSELVDYIGKKGFIPENLGHYIRGNFPNTGLKKEDESALAQLIPTLGRPAANLYEAIHPTMHLKQARRLANERNALAHIPEHELNAVTDYIHPDLPLRNLLDAARTGNYDAAFNVQSDLARFAREGRFSPFAKDRQHARQARELRERQLGHMRESLTEQGHQDIADLMRRGQTQYRRFKQIQPYAKTLAAIALGASPIKSAYKLVTSNNNS